MIIQEFSLSHLEMQLEELPTVIEKVQLLAKEIRRCENAIKEIDEEEKHFNLDSIRILDKPPGKKSFVTILIDNRPELKLRILKKIIKETVLFHWEECSKYLSFAEELQENLTGKLKINSKTIDNKQTAGYTDNGFSVTRIRWMDYKEKLLELFDALHHNKMIPGYSEEELLIHFTDEKGKPFIKSNKLPEKFCWLRSDNAFSILLYELGEREVIMREEKYKVVAKHFLNRKGKEFILLPQKKHYAQNYTKTGNLIKIILDGLNFTPKTIPGK
jgi:hypothetical protein